METKAKREGISTSLGAAAAAALLERHEWRGEASGGGLRRGLFAAVQKAWREREREKEGGARALTTLWLTPPHSGVASTSRPLLSRFHSIRGPARAAKPQVLSSVPHCTIFQSLNVSLISFLFKLKLSKGVFDYTRA